MTSKIEEEKKQQELVSSKVAKMDTSKFTATQQTVEEALKEFEANLDKGLTSDEAKARLEKHGPNELDKEDEDSLWAKILEQFEDTLVQILLAAATISFVIAITGKSRMPRARCLNECNVD